MSDIVERLEKGMATSALNLEAAATIEALRAENAKLRARLDEFDAIQATPENQWADWMQFLEEKHAAARAAMGESDE